MIRGNRIDPELCQKAPILFGDDNRIPFAHLRTIREDV
jgi:hypothetical protein